VEVEKYHQTGSRILGVVGVVLALLAFVTTARDGVSRGDVAWLAGFTVMGLLSWAALLRPQVRLTAEDLVLRNMLVTVTVPLAAIDKVAVGRMLVVVAGDRRFISPAVARPQREVMRGRLRHGDRDPGQLPDFIEDRVRARADDARTRLGYRRELAPDVRREPAWVEIGLLAFSVLVLVVGLVL
jgi:hypothetical protein